MSGKTQLYISLHRSDIQIWPDSLHSCSIRQPKVVFFLSDIIFVYFKALWPLIWTKKVFSCLPFAGSCLNFSVCIRKSCKDFYIMKSDGLYITNAMKSWFCYKQFIFVLYWKLLCNTTEISTIANWRLYYLLKGALLSQSDQTLTCGDSKCFHCAVCLHLPFDFLQVMTMVNVTSDNRHFWSG